MSADVLDLTARLAESLVQPAVLPAPAPGIYRGVPMAVYHAWDAASNSRLSKLRRSPAHLRSSIDEPAEDTASQIVGRAIHSAILEPNDFERRYGRFSENVDRRTKAGKESWERLLNEFGEGFLLKAADYDCALRTRDAVHAHASAGKLLAELREVELSIVWVDEETGLTCKARFDGYTGIGGGIIADVKSTEDAGKLAFERSILTYGYHRQGALYLEGAAANRIDTEWYVNIAVEKKPPYAVAVYRLKPEAIQAGRVHLAPLKKIYAACVATNEWPAYPQDVVDIGLPHFADRQINDEMVEFGTNYEVVG